MLSNSYFFKFLGYKLHASFSAMCGKVPVEVIRNSDIEFQVDLVIDTTYSISCKENPSRRKCSKRI